MFSVLDDLLDELSKFYLDHSSESHPRVGRVLQAHEKQLFSAATADRSYKTQHDWAMYCQFTYGSNVPELRAMQWPPKEDDWVAFLNDARSKVSSYNCFTGVIGTVCEVGTQHFYSQGRAEPGCQGLLDPRIIDFAVHKRTMRRLPREYGSTMTQVAGITMAEARNAHCFVDRNSVRGLAMGAAFHVGFVHGGRRPRTSSLTAMQLRDVHFTAEHVQVAGCMVMVPAVELVFQEEKCDDIQGPRSGTESYSHMSDYAEWMQRGSASWLYQFLVMRGAFVQGDPVRLAAAGENLLIRADAMDWFLFCHCRVNIWIDASPVSVQT